MMDELVVVLAAAAMVHGDGRLLMGGAEKQKHHFLLTRGVISEAKCGSRTDGITVDGQTDTSSTDRRTEPAVILLTPHF